MRKILSFLMLVIGVVSFAQNKIDNAGRVALQNASDNATYNVIIEFNNGKVDFGNIPVDITANIGNMAVVRVTPEQMEQIAELPQVLRVSMGPELRLLLDSRAKGETGVVEPIHTGQYTTMPVKNVEMVEEVKPEECAEGTENGSCCGAHKHCKHHKEKGHNCPKK